jgi:hypothetical protein
MGVLGDAAMPQLIHPDPVTGKPVADTTVYDYDATAQGGKHYRLTFRRENTILNRVPPRRAAGEGAP